MRQRAACTPQEAVPAEGCKGSPSGSSGKWQPSRWASLLVPWLVRRQKLVLYSALLVGLAGTFFSVKLYSNLRSGFEELLPDTAQSVVAGRTIGSKLHSITHLSVVFEGRDGDALERLADDLAARLRKLPPNLVEEVDYRTEQIEAFVHRYGGLYLSDSDLDAIQRRIDRRIAWEKQKANPFTHFLDDEDASPAPPLDFSDIEAKYSDLSGASAQFRNGYFQSPDGKTLVLLVRPPEGGDLAQNERVLTAVQREVKALNPRSYDPTVEVGYDGEVATLLEEQKALVSDLASSTVVVLVLVSLALWIYFRRFTAIFSICGALAVGCALTFGLSWFLVGYLNANTAFLGSIVVGNGINVSIIVVARFLEERRRGRALDEAIQTAWSSTLAATFIASFGAGLAYLSLAGTDFRGFSQFGVIGALGMALCWVTAYLLLPPLLVVLDSRSRKALLPGRRSLIGRFVGWLNEHHRNAVRIASLALVFLSVAGVATYRGSFVEYDFTRLRSQKSMEEGAGFWGDKVDQVFKVYLTPLVIRAETPAELDRVVAELQRERGEIGAAADPFREVRTLASIVPPDQAQKIPRLLRLRASLSDARLGHLDKKTRQKVLEFRPPADIHPVTLADVPAQLRLPLVEKDGSAGRIALVFQKAIGWKGPAELNRMSDLIRGSIRASGARAQALGQPLLLNDIVSAIMRDGPIATAIAFVCVLLLVAVVFRRIRPTVQVIGSLLLGVVCLVGAAAWGRVRLNFLNFVVLPITFGIGVDYAANIVKRWNVEGRDSLNRVLRETGGAVGLCSLTTIIGYGSLMVADSLALRGFGFLAAAGEVACVTAALVALPAWLPRPGSGESANDPRPSDTLS